jgi:hypothetical protein
VAVAQPPAAAAVVALPSEVVVEAAQLPAAAEAALPSEVAAVPASPSAELGAAEAEAPGAHQAELEVSAPPGLPASEGARPWAWRAVERPPAS